MKILHSEVSTGWGGQEIRVYTEMLAMRQRGHRLYLATPQRTTIHKKCTEAGFKIIPFRDEKFSYPLSIVRMASFLRREKIDVVNTHSSRDGWIIGTAARLAGVPLVIRSRHIDVSYPNVFVSRIAYARLADEVITTSDAIREGLISSLRLFPERVKTIATGIDLNQYHPDKISTLREELSIGKDTWLVGMISVLRSWKGHKYLLEAAQILKAAGVNIHFIISGSGPREERIKDLIIERRVDDIVHMLGHRDDVENVLAGVDCIVLPSTAHEGIPQILLQAMAMKKPVVGSDIGGIPEVVKDGETGLLVPSKNGEAIAEAIRRLQMHPDQARQMGQRGYEMVIQKHGIEHMCETLEALYFKHLTPVSS